jgi:ribosome-associated translation inhibitor RaiA
MDPVITARHCEVTPELRQRAAAIVQRISLFAGRPMETSVVFGLEAGQSIAELRLHIARGDVFIARGEGSDHATALDRAEEKIRKQVERAAGRTRDVRHSAELNQV